MDSAPKHPPPPPSSYPPPSPPCLLVFILRAWLGRRRGRLWCVRLPPHPARAPFFAAAQPAARSKPVFETQIYPELIENQVEGFGVYFAPAAWADLLAQTFTGKESYNTRREYYAGLPEPGDWRASLPDGFSLRPVDAALLDDPQISGLDDLREEMCSERPSVPDFLGRSFGLAAIYDNQLAGWCLSEYNSGEACEIGIASMPPYRRRGLAVCMTKAFTEMAVERGIRQIGWHCWASNTPSGATARKAGLSKICDYQAFVVILQSD